MNEANEPRSSAADSPLVERLTRSLEDQIQRLSRMLEQLQGFDGDPPRVVAVPDEVPKPLRRLFSMDGRIPISTMEGIPSNPPGISVLLQSDVDTLLDRERDESAEPSGSVRDVWLRESLSEHSIAGSTVGVVSAARPLHEAIVLRHQGQPISLVDHPCLTDDPRLTTYSGSQLRREGRLLDALVVTSSVHDAGLGLDGSSLDPRGDLRRLQHLRSLLRPDGLLFLFVPCGADRVVWRGGRIYGPLRLPHLLERWSLEGIYGLPPRCVGRNGRVAGGHWSAFFDAAGTDALVEALLVLRPSSHWVDESQVTSPPRS